MLIFNRCLCGLMPNLIKKTVTVSSIYARFFFAIYFLTLNMRMYQVLSYGTSWYSQILYRVDLNLLSRGFKSFRTTIFVNRRHVKWNVNKDNRTIFVMPLGVVHKQRLQQKGGLVVQKCRLFVNVHKVENVNGER